MAFTGGDLTEITYNHPSIGDGRLYPKAGEDSTFDLGGFTSDDDAQGVAGNAAMIDKMTAKRWNADATIAWDMTDTNELDKLQQMAGSPVQADWTITHMNGTVWGGKGKPVGDVTGSLKDATIKMKIAGGGQLKKLA